MIEKDYEVVNADVDMNIYIAELDTTDKHGGKNNPDAKNTSNKDAIDDNDHICHTNVTGINIVPHDINVDSTGGSNTGFNVGITKNDKSLRLD